MDTKPVFHGSDIEKICEYYHLNKDEIVRFGANVNPLRLKEKVKTDIAAVERSVQFLKSGFVDYEFRTTVTGSLHTAQDMTGIGEWLKGGKVLYLQKFVNSGSLIDQSVTGCDDDVLRGYRDMLQAFLPTRLRGIDD